MFYYYFCQNKQCCRLQAIYGQITVKNFVKVYTVFNPCIRGNLLLRKSLATVLKPIISIVDFLYFRGQILSLLILQVKPECVCNKVSTCMLWGHFIQQWWVWFPPLHPSSDGHAVSLMSVYAMSIALVGWKVYCPNMAKYTRRIINDPLKWAVGQRELDDKHFSPLSTAPATLVAGTLLAKVGPIQLFS